MGWFVSVFFGLAFFCQVALAEPYENRLSDLPEEELWASLHEQFLLGEELAARFDEAVKKGKSVSSMTGGSLEEGLVYARLQALRGFHEELESELESRMLLIFFVEDSASTSSGMEAWVRNRSERFRKKLGIRDETYSYSMFPLLSFAKDFDRARGFGLESLSSPIVLEEYRAWRARFRRNGGKVRGISQLRAMLEDSATRIHSDWVQGLQVEPGRLNPDLKIFPSTGSEGNITGSAYPKGSWSLTFDDGPGVHTSAVLRNLKTHALRASFFVLTAQLEKSSELASFAIQAFQDGHDLYSHSYQHLQIPRLPVSLQKHEIEGALQGFESILGFRPDLFRLPYGAGVRNPVVRENLVKSCQVHVFWNVDTLDWQDRDPASIVERALGQMKTLGRGVILFHDIHWQSVVASERLMSYLNSEGLSVITLSEFVKNENGGAKWGCKPGWDPKPE
ncbi:MAG: polysaccharide deacetylase family protein [Bdellovibrionales bacterium]|nr:polysaccharide deacetylase family protein [Bdellovibrionales bacterium]